MKKTLVALAALAASASFAQSSVTISGLLDFSAANVAGSVSAPQVGPAFGTTSIGSATSQINFMAVDDIGGGMKATAYYQLDPRAQANDATGALARHQAYVGLEGGFGNVKLGSIDSLMLKNNGIGNVFGTATGGGYATTILIGSAIRQDRSVSYDSPNMGGLTASVVYTPGHDTTTASGAESAFETQQRQITEYGATYANGPFNAGLAVLQAGSRTNAIGSGATLNTPANTASSTFTSLSANYNMGKATIYGAVNGGKTLGAALSTSGAIAREMMVAGYDTNGSRVGVKVNMGAIDLLAGYAVQTYTPTGSADVRRTTTGLRADYTLSKRTAAYLVYESTNMDTNSDGKTTNITAVGIRTSF
jgi:predicted porin